ncbi:hypothetical protein SARC_05947 [Sphaeroforma arctica JP610]|uniref:Uncharacterized protein n=1 Tax=Sphaeroforma arctica JP610 TaxID=667725 RepID=A0A0L0FY37_9EUKA|nr:hypothetical protein SARC_05947 [Sphaeroforma arctica JP610]KNC81745.1 hypothetical protein SARC_05947 [Sphaeroforma arctica JP610]|eukprot:XP_014155647.1 hypothetical protein SARC_05947 [Sphaeroforma arctica JP610]
MWRPGYYVVAFELGVTVWEVFPRKVAIEALGGLAPVLCVCVVKGSGFVCVVKDAVGRDLVVVLSSEHVDVNGAEDLCDVFVKQCEVKLVVVVVCQRRRDGDVVGMGDGFSCADGSVAKAGMMDVETVSLESIQVVAPGRFIKDFDGGTIVCDKALGEAVGSRDFGKGESVTVALHIAYREGRLAGVGEDEGRAEAIDGATGRRGDEGAARELNDELTMFDVEKCVSEGDD